MSLLDTRRNINDIYAELKRQREQLDILISSPTSDTPTSPTTNPPTMPGQAANQVRNGSFAHSVNSWAGHTNGTANQDYECAYWFSHSDAADTAMDLSNTLTVSGRIEELAATRTDYTQQFLLMGA